ncbi:MAG: 1,4-alpha-glucan branching protein GlgB [Deltaproteobacteria bacterium]|nr:1,4-alpha-glucan branching protein GlgB [Deltaproteobacteria bacterium]
MNERVTDYDLHLLGEGTHLYAYEKLGAHPTSTGVHFAVWAPNARAVSVVGDFNGWSDQATPLVRRDGGVWTGLVPGLLLGSVYKYAVLGADGVLREKADPYAFASELRPKTASVVTALGGYAWGDHGWMRARAKKNALDAPISIYEVHLGSFRRVPEEGNRWLTYAELAERLADYASTMGYTHVELLPITEHPFDGSWGYQVTGYYAPTARFGTPHDFKRFVDVLHQRGIGVILDWVPSHFPRDGHALGTFDGTHLYEHADPRQGEHREWDTYVFNYGRREVASFLLSNALYWLREYHLDGLRVDAVASMLYLDYNRKPGEWVPNAYGGRENLEAVSFLRRLNEHVYGELPDVLMIAEESTSWPMVARPTYLGGLGFGLKWNMGWMHDVLEYMSKDPVHRSWHHQLLTFGLLYAFSENFVLPFSHDEVVHLKRSLLSKMPGDVWQKHANLRLLFAFMTGSPGKKLLFMGQEIGQWQEWSHDRSLDWHVLDDPRHRGLQRCVADLNHLYRSIPALHELDCVPEGFRWIECNDAQNGVFSWERRDRAGESVVLVCNFTPVVRHGYRIGLPSGGRWIETLNTDADAYGGSNVGNGGAVYAEDMAWHGRHHSVSLTLPPLGALVLRRS